MRQRRQPVGVQPGQRGCPLRGLGLAVALPAQVGGDAVKAHRVAVEKGLIVQAFFEEHKGQRQHHCRIRAWLDRHPLGAEVFCHIRAQRADVDKAHAGIGAGLQAAGEAVQAGTAVADPGVALGQPAEGHHQIAVLGHHRPARGLRHMAVKRANDVGQQHQRGVVAVVALGANEAALGVQKPLEQSLSVVHATGARPAVGAGVDALVAVFCADAGDFTGEQVEDLVPADLDEGVAATLTPLCRGAVLQPAGADRRAPDTAGAVEAVGDVLVEAVGRRVARVVADGGDPLAVGFDQTDAPVVGRQRAAPVCHRLSPGWRR